MTEVTKETVEATAHELRKAWLTAPQYFEGWRQVARYVLKQQAEERVKLQEGLRSAYNDATDAGSKTDILVESRRLAATPKPEYVESVAETLWPWMRHGFRLCETRTWSQINKGSAAHDVACDAARAVIRGHGMGAYAEARLKLQDRITGLEKELATALEVPALYISPPKSGPADVAPRITDKPVLTEAEKARSAATKAGFASKCQEAAEALTGIFPWNLSAEGFGAWLTIQDHLTAKAKLFRDSAQKTLKPEPVRIGAFTVGSNHFPHCPVRVEIPRGTILADMPIKDARALAAAITAQADAAEKEQAHDAKPKPPPTTATNFHITSDDFGWKMTVRGLGPTPKTNRDGLDVISAALTALAEGQARG